jgi:uncharacterized membrane protein YdbT with pleckstrin-like domain
VPFPRRLLAERERLILDLRPHWIALILPGIVAVLIVAAEILLFALFDPPALIGWAVILVGIVLFVAIPVRAALTWATSHFVVTSDRVIHRSGWLAKRSMEMPLERINDVTFSQTVFERMVGAGSLRIQSGSEYGQNHFRDIRRPEEVQKRIYETGEEKQLRMDRAAEGGPPPDTAEPAASPLEEIERLASLKARGAISEEEFEIHKRRLLGRL